MPPMAVMGDVPVVSSEKPRGTTNFSIAAIMSSKVKEEPVETEGDNGKPPGGGSKPAKQRLAGRCNCPQLDKVRCSLDNKDLWDKFSELGTEMIITRSGRRMFPVVRIGFSNLDFDADPNSRYLVLLDVVPADNKRYRYTYSRSAWLVAGKADPSPPHRLYCHPDAPYTRDQLRKQVVSFEKVKVTNNEADKTGQLILNSMHKFQPRVYLVRRQAGQTHPVTDIEAESYKMFVFPETQFTAVTAYQNQLITKLKIESNPFAKGFRDSKGYDSDDMFPPMGGGPMGLDRLSMMVPDRLSMMMPAAPEDNNNVLMHVEKARAALLMHPQVVPPLPAAALPLPAELLARYSIMQAGLYNPALLAAALRSPPAAVAGREAAAVSPPSHRFSPYHVPRLSPASSPRSSPGSPASSPPFL